MQNLSSIRQLGAELWTDSHTKVSFAVPLYPRRIDLQEKYLNDELLHIDFDVNFSAPPLLPCTTMA